MGEVLQVQADFSGFEEVIKKMKEVLKPFESLKKINTCTNSSSSSNNSNSNNSNSKQNTGQSDMYKSFQDIIKKTKLPFIDLSNTFKQLSAPIKNFKKVISSMSNQTNNKLSENPYKNIQETWNKLKTEDTDITSKFKELQSMFKELSETDFSESFKKLNEAFEELNGSEELEEINKSFDKLKNSEVFRKFDKAFDEFNKDLAKSNNLLSKQNKHLKKSTQSLNLMKMLGSGLKMGALGLGGLAAGGAAGLIGGALKQYSGHLSKDLMARNIGITNQQSDALTYASKMLGMEDSGLIQALDGIQTALQDTNQWGAFANLNLNAAALKNKESKTDVLFEVLDAMQSYYQRSGKMPTGQLAEIMSGVGIQFEQFRFVLRDGTKDIRNYYKVGKDLNNYNDDSVDTLKNAERKTITFAEKFAGVMRQISVDLAPSYIKALDTAIPLIENFANAVANGIRAMTDFITAFANSDDKGAFLKDKAGELLTAAGEGLKTVWDGITEYCKTKWDEVVLFFKDKWRNLVTDVKIFFNNALVPMSFGQLPYLMKNEAGEAVVDTLRMKENEPVLSKMWNEFTTGISSFFGKEKKVNDAVITKTGQVIHTSPQDYIFAMKRPQDLAAAGASQSGGYTVNIYNPVVKDDKDIRQLKNELERLIRSFNSKR